MVNNTIVFVMWKHTKRVEIFTNLGKLYGKYSKFQLGVSRAQLNRRDIYTMYENEVIYLQRCKISK